MTGERVNYGEVGRGGRLRLVSAAQRSSTLVGPSGNIARRIGRLVCRQEFEFPLPVDQTKKPTSAQHKQCQHWTVPMLCRFGFFVWLTGQINCLLRAAIASHTPPFSRLSSSSSSSSRLSPTGPNVWSRRVDQNFLFFILLFTSGVFVCVYKRTPSYPTSFFSIISGGIAPLFIFSSSGFQTEQRSQRRLDGIHNLSRLQAE